MLAIRLSTPHAMMQTIKERFKTRRLERNLTQEGLANKSGVSLGSVKRFENSGQIALESLLKLAVILDCLDDFESILLREKNAFSSIDELLHSKKDTPKKRGAIK